MSALFVSSPKIDPALYLPAAEAKKTASIRLTSSPSYWDDEIVQTLLRDHPYIPPQRIVVNFKRKDEAQGAAFGYIGIIGAPQMSIPVIIKNRELAPLDLLIVRNSQDVDAEQGSGDMTDDKVIPLTQETFEQALDTGEIGDVVPEAKVRGCGYTEDGTSLRLPFRGRTVLASYMGCKAQDKTKLANLLSDKSTVAGFVYNGTEEVINSWLEAKEPTCTVQTKLASTPVEPSIAYIPTDMPKEKSDFLAAEIFVTEDQTKAAVKFATLDLANPSAGLHNLLVYEDATYSLAPGKVAVADHDKSEEELAKMVAVKVASGSLTKGSVVCFALNTGLPEDPLSAPAKIASIVVDEANKTINVDLNNGLGQNMRVMLVPNIKTAIYDDKSKAWLLPQTSFIYNMGEYVEAPIQAEKVAAYFQKQVTDSLTCSGGQYTLSIQGDTFGDPQCDETKMASILNAWFVNGNELLAVAKEASANGSATIRFRSNLSDQAMKVAKLASQYAEYPKIAAATLKEVKLPLELAIKLAASVGDPAGADAVLSAGFLSEDNIAEFINLADQFEATVGKLARLLLGIRMGFPGDETATVVAMKSLQRVAERLQSATQETNA